MNWRHPPTSLNRARSSFQPLHGLVIKVWSEKSKGGEKVEMCKFARYPSLPNPTQPNLANLANNNFAFLRKIIHSHPRYQLCVQLLSSLLQRENDSTFNNHPSYSFISSPQNSLFIILNQLYNTVFQAALKEKCRI